MHGLSSSHCTPEAIGTPLHTPVLVHKSFSVQALLSSHGEVLATLAQPLAGLHESAVQGFLSLQLAATPAQVDPAH